MKIILIRFNYNLKQSIIFFVLIFIGHPSKSQSEFQLTYGHHSGSIYLMHKTNNNNLILLTDYLYSNSHILLKTDSVGNILMKNCYSRSQVYGKKIVEVNNTFFLLSTIFIPIATSNYTAAMVMKFNNNLDILWSKKYFIQNSSHFFYDICTSEEGGFLICGHGCAGNNIVINCDSSGNIIWQKNFLNGTPSYLIIKDKKNEFLICSANYNTPLCIYRINSMGSLLFYKKFNSIFITPTSFIKTNDKGYTITGFESDENINYIMHLDNALNFVWGKAFSYNKSFKILKIVQAENENYFFSGFIYPNNSPYQNALFGSTDVNGNLFWSRTNSDFSLNLVDCGYLSDIALSENNHVYLTGWGNYGATLVRIDSHGNGFCFYDTVSFNISSFNTSVTYPTPYITNTNFISDTVSYTVFNDTLLEKEIICGPLNIIDQKPYTEAKIVVFPNPAKNSLTIETIQKSTIEILNIQGQTILQKQIQQGKTDIDISGLAKGLYILRLSSSDKTEVTKFVKE